jgi:hypothetical protein
VKFSRESDVESSFTLSSFSWDGKGDMSLNSTSIKNDRIDASGLANSFTTTHEILRRSDLNSLCHARPENREPNPNAGPEPASFAGIAIKGLLHHHQTNPPSLSAS